MHRNQIINHLNSYNPFDSEEESFRECTLKFILENDQCFERTLEVGHVTGSAWIINPQRTHTLLIHHYKLDRWFQPGGHCDGDPDVLAVAVKEAFEETGLKVSPYFSQIFDIDNHLIPARGDVPQHIHFDIRFLCVASMTEHSFPTNRETKEVKWVELSEVGTYSKDQSLSRMVKKTQTLVS